MTAQVPASNQPAPTGVDLAKATTYINTALGGFLAGATLLLTITTNSPSRVLPFALIIGGILALVPVSGLPVPVRLITTGIVFVGLIAAGVVVFLDPNLLTRTRTVVRTQTHTTTNVVYRVAPLPTAPPVVLRSPHPGSLSAVSGCLTVEFTATPPTGWAFAVGDRANGDDLTYFEGDTNETPGSAAWSAQVILGDTNQGMDTRYEISVVMIPTDELNYLSASRGDINDTWWAGKTNPPGSVPASSFEVTRNSNPSVACH